MDGISKMSYPECGSLIELAAAAKRDTDKQWLHGYLHAYETLFSTYRDTDGVVMELGVYKGDSLRLWRDWFCRAQIVGLDISTTYFFTEPRVRTFLCDCGDGAKLAALMAAENMRPVIIMDDASHDPVHQAAAFNALFPFLRPGGMYVIEDWTGDKLPLMTELAGRHAQDILWWAPVDLSLSGMYLAYGDSRLAVYVRKH